MNHMTAVQYSNLQFKKKKKWIRWYRFASISTIAHLFFSPLCYHIIFFFLFKSSCVTYCWHNLNFFRMFLLFLGVNSQIEKWNKLISIGNNWFFISQSRCRLWKFFFQHTNKWHIHVYVRTAELAGYCIQIQFRRVNSKYVQNRFKV